MNILVLGGTRFLGPHIVTEALARGHRVTTFNRGSRPLPEMPGLRQTRGERGGDYAGLTDESFDAVVDTSAFHPDDIRASSAALSKRCSRYCLISSVSVYADDFGNLDETAAVAPPPVPLPPAMTPEHYGSLKAVCERHASDVFGERIFVVRPGLIAGPGDQSHRFGYWVRRIARGGDVIVPEPRHAPVQFIDVRDLAAWLIVGLERELSGTYNADGPGRPITMAEFLDECIAAGSSDVRLRWADAQRLLDLGVEPWTELPLWMPPSADGFLTFDSSKARRDGLAFRPVSATIASVRAWDREHGPSQQSVKTLTPGREVEILTDLGVKAG